MTKATPGDDATLLAEEARALRGRASRDARGVAPGQAELARRSAEEARVAAEGARAAAEDARNARDELLAAIEEHRAASEAVVNPRRWGDRRPSADARRPSVTERPSPIRPRSRVRWKGATSREHDSFALGVLALAVLALSCEAPPTLHVDKTTVATGGDVVVTFD